MAWTLLWEMIAGLLADVEPVKVVLSGGKAAAGAAASYLMKRTWRKIVGAEQELSGSKCHIAACQRQPAAGSKYRGLCLVCYGKAKRLVDSGQTSWEGLASKGLCKSGSSGDPFDDAYSKAMEGE